ncbi:ROK family transcriptional regulator [Sphingobacterium ginsenosidimutans]|uniref:ROK family transcriptional regulator n=1 Tax=Sphingobacterium ginsenosidimutans TaxID=687845 RepID=A0ABP7ZZT5_9SPHI
MKADILRLLYYNETQSIADISKNLSKSTPIVTKNINELVKQGLILDNGLGESTGGRRASKYGLNNTLPYLIISIAIDQHYSSFAISNLAHNIIAQQKDVPINLKEQNAGEIILQKLEDIVKESKIEEKKIIGVGISMPGFVNPEEKINDSYPKNSSLHHLYKQIEEKLNITTVIDNDSRCIAWAEKEFGHGVDIAHTLVINLNWGVGLGIIINGEIFKGATGFAGEFSHIPLSDKNTLCSCGKRGCLEVEASLNAAIQNTESDIENGEYSIYSTFVKVNSNKADALIEAAKLGDQIAINNLGKIGYMLGKGISTLLHILNPNKIIISGRGAEVGDIIAPQIQVAINEFSIPKIAKMTKIEISSLHKDAQQMGTAALVADHLIDNIIN